MKRMFLAMASAVALTAAAAAQTTTTTTTTTTVEPEVRTKVKQYVTTHRGKSVTAPAGVEIRAGATLPESIEIQSFPAEVGVTRYRYVSMGDRTVLVEPGSRKIIEVID